jgi:hypothetical protein
MRRRLTALAVSAALIAVPVAGCGDKAPGIPKHDAAELIRLLKKAQTASDNPEQHCDTLLASVAKLDQKVSALPSKVDKDVRDSLANGVRNLTAKSQSLCNQTKTPTTTTTTPTTTIPTTPPTTTQTIPPQTTHTTPPHTQTIPPQTVPPQTTPCSGGTGPGNATGTGGGKGHGGGNGNGNGNGGGGIGPGD